MTGDFRPLRSAGPSRPAFFVASALVHAAIIGSLWHGRPLPRTATAKTPALLVALPTATTADRIPHEPYRSAVAAPEVRKASARAAERTIVVPQPVAGGLDVGASAIAIAAPAVTEAVTPPDEPLTPEPPAAPPPAAAASRSVEKADLNLAYHRLRAAQESMRLLHGQASHLAWLQRRVTDLLASAVATIGTGEGGLCQARLEGDALAIDCDRVPLRDALQNADGDLAIFLRKLVTLTAPDQGLEIAILPDTPPVIARL